MSFIHANYFVFEFGRNRREFPANALLSCLLAGNLLKGRDQSSIIRSGKKMATNNKCTVYVSILDPGVGKWLVQLFGQCSGSCVTRLKGEVSQRLRIVKSVTAKKNIYLRNWDDYREIS